MNLMKLRTLTDVKMSSPDSSVRKLAQGKLDPRTVTLDSLPPCKVCGSAASGVHYGVVSCEACKSFFRRSFGTNRKYKCRNKRELGGCKISSHMKCAFCRIQKCQEVGMSREAMKVGRYTHAQRTLNIVQMKHHRDGLSSGQCSSPTTDSLSRSGADNSIMRSTLPLSDRCQQFGKSDCSDDRMAYLADMNEQACLVKAIVEANEKHNTLFHLLKDEKEVSERMLHHYNECLLKDKICGPVEAPSWQEFENFFNITGLEMDKRVDLASVLIKQMETLVKFAIKFAKAIPGFRELTLSDQASLIKGGFFEFGNVSGYKASNPELKITILVDGTMIGDNDMFWPGERAYVNRLMDFFKRLQNLRINTEEDALLQAIVLFSPGRADLEQAERVEKLHWDIVWSFWTLLHQNHQNASIKFTKIIDCLVELRDLTELDLKYVRNLPFDFSETVSSELVCELVNLPR